MAKTGKVIKWNDERGFGFVKPDEGMLDVFLHIRALPRGSKRPVLGDAISYESKLNKDGKPRAFRAWYSEDEPAVAPNLVALIVGCAYLLAVVGAVVVDKLPALVPIVYLAFSFVAYVAYALDKEAARNGRWRTSERSLHILALFGGWPGAFFAQEQFRHKTKKIDFRVLFWGTVVLNVLFTGLMVAFPEETGALVESIWR